VTPAELSTAVRAAVQAAVDAGDLVVPVPDEVRLERPKVKEHGDYATSVALQLAKPAGQAPRQVAEAIATQLRGSAGISTVDVAGPGFLNITLDAAAQGELARTVVTAGAGYGGGGTSAGHRYNLEFVSANPTGPLHLGHVRWAAVGDALARILQFTGAEVAREYYFNDAGVQIDRFAGSLLAAAKGEPTPEGGYGGAYIGELAAEVVTAQPDLLDRPEPEALAVFRREGMALMFAEIRRSLADFGVVFDVYFNEKDLHDRGALKAALTRLTEEGHVFEQDGATWLRTTDFGDDKDRVIVRSNGERTYFSADCAYYLNKRDRGYSPCIYMLGADHHGYVGRLKAMAACSGDDPEKDIEVLIGQFVKMVKDGEEVKLSKRTGNIVSLDDVIDMIGVDAARYVLARSSVDHELVLDVDLLTTNAPENPVWYIQYAHARMASVKRNAAELGFDKGTAEDFKAELLAHPREEELLAALADFPRVVAQAAGLRKVHQVAHYLEDMAKKYHGFYTDCRILPMGDDKPTDLNRARMWLAEAAQTVLRNGLDLLGVSAPERM
jgi:arginyl-tRNA synthetase